MATVSRTALTSSMLVVLLLPMTIVVLLQGPAAPSTHAFPIDDFGDSIRLTFNPSASTNISSTVDHKGDIHMVWEDYRSGNGDIYYMKLDDEGNKLTNDAKISNDTTLSRNPSVATDSDGHIYIVWEDIDNGSSELLFAKLWYYEGNITFQENGLRVSDSDPSNSTEPAIAVCPDGNIAMVWTDARHNIGDGNLEIYYKRLRPSGTSLTADTRITGDVGRSEHPRLDIAPDGTIHIVWYDFRDSDNGLVINHGIFYRKVHADGTPLTNETRITFASPQSRPDVSVDTDGNVHIAFDDDRYASFDIFYTLLDGDGLTVVDDRNISPKDEYESRNPRIALSDSNAVDVVWQDEASGRWAAHYSALNYLGDLEVYDQALTSEVVGNATKPVVMCAKDNNTLVLYTGDYPNMEVFYSRTHRPDLAIFAIDVSFSSVRPLVDTIVFVNATVRNLEGDTVTGVVVRMSVDSYESEDVTIPMIAAGGAYTVVFEHVATPGDSEITLTVDPDQAFRETYEHNNQVATSIEVRVPGVELAADPYSQQVNPGDTASFDLYVTNEGNADFVICLDSSAPEDGWSVDIDGAPSAECFVLGGSTETVPVGIVVPEDESPGVRVFNITAWCAERASVNSTLTLMVDVLRFGNLTVIAPAGQAVEPTMPVTFAFTVSNDANANESFLLEALDNLGWETNLSIERVELAPGEGVYILMTVTPDRYDPLGTLNTVTLRVTSEDLPGNVANGNVLCVVGHHREVSLAMANQELLNGSVPADQEIIYTLLVSNLGNSDDAFRISLEGTEGFWAVLNTTYAFLGAGEQGRVSLTMRPGDGTLAGLYSFNVTVASESDDSVDDTLGVGISVQPFYDLRVSADYPRPVVKRGETAHVNVTVENRGNIRDTVVLSAFVGTFNETTATLGNDEVNLVTDAMSPFELQPGGSATVLITIPALGSVETGFYDMYLDFNSMIDPTVSVTQTIVVTVEDDPSWLSVWVILIIVSAVAVVVLVLILLVLRKRRAEEARAAEEARRRMQVKRRPPGPPRVRPNAP